MPEKLAICPGSFDPPTNGHVDIIARALRLFDRVIIAVTVNVSKRPMFSLEERMSLIAACFPGEPRLEVESLDGLLAGYAASRGAVALVKGLRAPSDFEYELQMAQMNHHLTPELETVFLAADAVGSYVSSSLVKEVAALGGDVTGLVPTPVADALTKRLAR
ncbi:MAG: pantetheine-phosphate adenylyltransferase [Deltaproteobacteria bacterium]|nr:pantetheine-phosphate adenylyltransferase [Deltaproteobacteria bacterium]